MKTKWMIIPALALTLGCVREMDNNASIIDGEFTLYATSGENETKTVLQKDGSIYWSPADCINVFYGDKAGVFTSTNTEPAASAEFTGSLGTFVLDGETEFIASYPYTDGAVLSGNTLNLVLSSEQNAVEETFADELFISVAKSKDYNLHFFNVCGGVSFSLARDDIKKVVFKGNNGESLAGHFSVGFASDDIPFISFINDWEPSVSLTAPENSTFKSGVFYYIVLIPQVLSKGYTLELYTDELVETISSDSSVSIFRSRWGVLNNIGTIPPSVPNAIDLGLPSGTLWASFNLGASDPLEFGDYYAWGELETKDYYNTSTYKWYDSSLGVFTKYNSTDNKWLLDLEDDVAHVKLGEKWRIPTKDEVDELVENCEWVWDSDNRGYWITSKINGSCIFLPGAGGKTGPVSGFNLYSPQYITASFYTEHPGFDEYIYIIDKTARGYYCRELGFTIRPVYGDYATPVESVFIDKAKLELSVGDSTFLIPTVLPENAANKEVLWSSSNDAVATVSSTGVVTGISAGTTIITVTTSDRRLTSTCEVTVLQHYTTPEIIDLGLSVKWASFNLGASQPEEYGDYFAWGETDPYYSSLNPLTWIPGKETGYTWSSYKWCMGIDHTLTKYCHASGYGFDSFTDNNTFLEPEDDAAQVHLGRKWRMPSRGELEELINQCTWENSTENGVAGQKVTGPNGNSIFIPYAGCFSDDYYMSNSTRGYYWTSSLSTGESNRAYRVYMISSNIRSYPDERCRGYSIRPVYGDPITIIPKAIDLGLSVKWASSNLGAVSPEEYGDYFAWGETKYKEKYDWSTYKWSMGTNQTLTKYCSASNYGNDGFTDDKTILDLEDDAAHAILGGTWRTPTYEELDELLNQCTWEWTDDYKGTGIKGRIVTSNVPGYEGISIFLPAAGDRYGTGSQDFSGSNGDYWSSSLYTGYVPYSFGLRFSDYDFKRTGLDRSRGYSIRPVCKK